MNIKKKTKHIGIIPDGNRRWAVGHGMNKQDGYEHGLFPGLRLLQQAKENGIHELMYYGFTMDNCKRPKEQFQAFQSACVKAVELLTQEGADLLVIGDCTSKCFPKQLIRQNHPLFFERDGHTPHCNGDRQCNNT